jgi:hypothetical protein
MLLIVSVNDTGLAELPGLRIQQACGISFYLLITIYPLKDLPFFDFTT